RPRRRSRRSSRSSTSSASAAEAWMSEPVLATPRPHELRWAGILTLVIVAVLLGAMPGRLRLLPVWVPYLVAIPVLVPMLVVTTIGPTPRLLRIERVATLSVGVVALCATVANLVQLVATMLNPAAKEPGQGLLASAIGVWVTNVLAFALLFWQL